MSELNLATTETINNTTIIRTIITNEIICVVPSIDQTYIKQFIELMIEAHFNNGYYIKHLSELFDDLIDKSCKSNEQYDLWFIRNYPEHSKYTQEELLEWIEDAKHYGNKIILPQTQTMLT